MQNITQAEIMRLLNSQDSEHRVTALVYIARLDIQDALDSVIESLDDPEQEVRSTAAWALDLMGNEQAIPALIDALFDPHFHVRYTAGWALQHLGRPAVPHIISVLKNAEDKNAREMAYQILSRIQLPEAYDALERFGR